MSEVFFKSVLTESEVIQCRQVLLRHSCPSHFCRLWLGSKDRDGYGIVRFWFRGTRLKVKTHRLAFYLENNFPTMKGMHVSHICHTKDCIAVSHLSLETVAINNERKICVNNGECTGHYGYKRCILRYWSYLLMLVPYACSFEVSSDTFSYSEFACSFLQHFFFLDKCRESLYCLDIFLCEWQSVLASIFNICLYMRYVALYLIPIPEAIAREDLPVPKVLECTAEWQRSVKFWLHMVLFGAYEKTW